MIILNYKIINTLISSRGVYFNVIWCAVFFLRGGGGFNECLVRILDIGAIADHHCLSFLFMIIFSYIQTFLWNGSTFVILQIYDLVVKLSTSIYQWVAICKLCNVNVASFLPSQVVLLYVII